MNPSISPMGNGCKLCAGCTGCMFCGPSAIAAAGAAGFVGFFWVINHIMNMIRGIQAPDYTSKECSGCEKKYFCSYCIIRGLVAAKEKGFENCAWYSQYIPNEFRRLLI